MGELLNEFWLFLKEEKKWWLVPMLVVMGLVAVLVFVTYAVPGVAPFIYPLI